MSNVRSAIRTASVVALAGAMLLAGCSAGGSSSAAAHTVALVDVQPVEGASAPDLSDVASRLREMVSATGFANAQADVTSTTRVTVTVDGAVPVSQLQAALEPGPLLFRKVLDTGPDKSNHTVPTTPLGKAAEATIDNVKTAVGDQAWAAAVLANSPRTGPQISSDRTLVNVLAPFAKLTPSQVAVLPAAVQFYVPQIGCGTLDARPRGATDNPQGTVAVCDKKSTKYLLDVAKVSGSDVGSASSAANGSSWAVNIVFSTAGAQRWTALTTEAFNNVGGRCNLTQPATQAGHGPVCEIAVTQDNNVLTAPAIQAVSSSQAQVSGSLSQQQATILAAQLAVAGLPVHVAVLSVSEGAGAP
jgi:preprotein translocase subunit SecD